MLTQLLYDQDFHQWLEKTIDQLEQQDFNNLDIDHLIEELKDLGKSDKNDLESNVSGELSFRTSPTNLP
ncbi:MAG: DUF29 family protein [Snowella sp.]|nr:DUF29 family protein [Snowella sp.]